MTLMEQVGLTPVEAHYLTQCYSEGFSESQVAQWCGVQQSTVAHAIRRACRKIVAAGLPHPQPYGRGSREELRRRFPFVNW